MSGSGAEIPAFGLFIDGAWGPVGRTFENVNPARPDEVVALHAAATGADVAAAYAAARRAAPAWGALSSIKRGEILDRAGQLLGERAASIARELTREEGKTLPEARAEVRRAVSILKYFAGECAQANGAVFPSVDEDTLLLSEQEPLGVVLVITPWNFPIALPTWKIAPALAFGNTVVWKPSELSPLSAVRLVEALNDAGLPAGVLNLITGFVPDVGNALLDAPELDALTFTGSNAAGRALHARASANGVKVQLELGGKNPLIVMPDADVEHVVAATIRGAMHSAGQKCSATSRAIVHPSIEEPYLEALRGAVERLVVGDPLAPETDIGPLVSDAQLARVAGYLERAADEGRELVVGGGRPALDGGWYVAPTVYRDVPSDSMLGQEEVFGPVLAVMTADTLEDALAIANDVEYGLSASIFTRDLGAAIGFARRVQAGVVHVNTETTGAEPHVPFGGMKASSSFSREQGKAARDFFTQTKTIYLTSPRWDA